MPFEVSGVCSAILATPRCIIPVEESICVIACHLSVSCVPAEADTQLSFIVSLHSRRKPGKMCQCLLMPLHPDKAFGNPRIACLWASRFTVYGSGPAPLHAGIERILQALQAGRSIGQTTASTVPPAYKPGGVQALILP